MTHPEKEKEMLENLEKAAKEKLRVEKEEEELRVKKEQEAWEKMPRWKKDKILRERRASSSTTPSQPASADNSRKNSSVQPVHNTAADKNSFSSAENSRNNSLGH